MSADTGKQPTKIAGKYNETAPSLINGEIENLQIDANANLKTSTQGGNVASGAADSGNPVKVGGKYNATPPTLDDGDRGDLELDVNGNTKVKEQYAPGYEDNTNAVAGVLTKPVASGTYSPSSYLYLAAAVTKANVKAVAGNVYSFNVSNANAAVRYFQLHNKATAPAAGETPIAVFTIPGGTVAQPAIREVGMDYFAPSRYFSTGIGWAISTTAATFTDAATASDHAVVSINYV